MNENKVFLNSILYKKVALEPKYLNKNVDKYLLNNLRMNLEGKCIKEGFVEQDSINIIRRSVGKTYGCDFSGNIIYDIVYSAKICNPAENNIIRCVIKNINKLGVLAENGPLSIIVAKQYHQDKSIFKNIEVGDYINVKVLGKKFELNDFKISVIGQIVKEGKVHAKKKIKVIANNYDFKNIDQNKNNLNIKYVSDTPLINNSDNDNISDNISDSDPEEYLDDEDIEKDFDKEYEET